MGQSVSVPAASAGATSLLGVKELEDLTYEKALSSARFMKCIRARHPHGLVIVKVAMRPPPTFKLTAYAQAIRRERDILADIPNALGYQRIVEAEQCGYLVRQYLHSSLYDRMSTRPFLDDIEKKWLAFQLLCALRDCHARNVYHGDIKTENILVTSWNWLYLSDFSSSFKKTYLPEDNPADFSYFFDISGRRTCYLAPERFLAAGEADDGRGVTWAMDVFSVGCVIAELFVEAPIFSLSQLFKYRKGEYDPELTHLNKIGDRDIRELVSHMTQVEPEARYSAEEYLNFWRRKAFPEYFYSFLHQYMGFITDPSSGHQPVNPETTNFGEADDRIDRIYYDFDKIAYFLGYGPAREPHSRPAAVPHANADMFPIEIDVPNNRHTAVTSRPNQSDDGTLIFLSLVLSALRHTARATARVRACDLMLAFAEHVTDEAKLDRILPHLVVLVNDKSDLVKIAALRAMTQLLAMVKIVAPVNAYVFTEYVRPRLQGLVYHPATKVSPIVRSTYAGCLASLAQASLDILDMVQALRAEGSIATVDPEAENGGISDMASQTLYDVARAELVDHFEAHAKALLTDPEPAVRRAMLGSVAGLCIFFGSSKSNDVILSHLNTYLNDRDWQLRCAFFRTIVGVATFLGTSSLEEFILPLMLQALTDPEEFVVERVVSSLATMADLGLFQKATCWELIDVISRLMLHPNIWIREAAAHFVSAATKFLSVADKLCIVLPLIRPYLRTPIQDPTETNILDSLKRPLPLPILEMAMVWSQKAERSAFWSPAERQRTFTFRGPDYSFPMLSSKDISADTLKKLGLREEDQQWLARLSSLGMTQEDEIGLVALRAYIHRVAARRSKGATSTDTAHLLGIIKLSDLDLTPQTIFFENGPKQSPPGRRHSDSIADLHGTPRTITDALMEASTSITERIGDDTLRHTPSTASREGIHKPKTLQERRRRSIDGIPAHPGSVSARAEALPGSHFSNASKRVSSSELSSRADSRESSVVSSEQTSRRTSIDPLRINHKASAISLLSRKDTPKTMAAISMDDTNAVGQLEGPTGTDNLETLPAVLHEEQRRFHQRQQAHANHTYDGTDPSVLKVLETLASENYPVDEFDFGPLVTPVSRRSSLRNGLTDADGPWRPQGIHVATFGEHSGSIVRILPSPDHVFFITGSVDGSVKIWDTLRLERNLIHRSRQAYQHSQGAQVTCLAFVENTHTFVSCATDGAVTVVKVDVSYIGDTTKYNRLRIKRTYQLPTGQYAVWSEHFRNDGRSILLLATNTSQILALDLRSMTIQYTMDNPVHHGAPTCFCLDRKRNWLLLCTTHGVLSFFDLRFRLNVRAWQLSGQTPIHRMALHPFKGRGRWVCIAGGTNDADITVWDVEKAECREAYRANASISTSTSNSTASKIGGSSDGKAPSSAAAASANAQSQAAAKELAQAFTATPVTDTGLLAPPPPPLADRSFRAFIMGPDANSDDRDSRRRFLITGGTDRRVRFWDLGRIEASVVVSGLASDEPQPKYTSLNPTPGLTVYLERLARPFGASTTSTNPDLKPTSPPAGSAGSPAKGNRDKGSGGAGGATPEKKSTRSRPSAGKESRTAVIAREQKALLRSHLDAITDVMVLHGSSATMLVSVDRRGCIYVFQ